MQEPTWIRFLPHTIRNRIAGRWSLLAILANSGWLFADKFIRLLIGVLIGAWVARYLGPAQYGELAYALAWVALFQALTQFAVDGIVVRDLALNQASPGNTLGSALFVRLIGAMTGWLAVSGAVAYTDGLEHERTILTAVIAGGMLFQAADVIDLWFQSQSQSKRTIAAKLCAYAIFNSTRVALILTHAPLISFAFAFVLESSIGAFALLYAYKNSSPKHLWRMSRTHISRLLHEGWPFVLSSAMIMIYMRIDQIIIERILGANALGIYAAAVSLSMLWHFVPVSLATSIAPFLARQKVESESAYQDALAQVFRLFALLAWISSIATALAAPTIISILYGTQYDEGIKVLTLHVFSNLFVFLGVAQGLSLVNEKKSWLSLYKTILGALTCICINIILVPQLGLSGAAISAILSQAASVVFSNIGTANHVLMMQIRSLLLITRHRNII